MKQELPLLRELIHRLQNPLSVISSTAQFCLDNLSPDERISQHLRVILRNVEKANLSLQEYRRFYKR